VRSQPSDRRFKDVSITLLWGPVVAAIACCVFAIASPALSF
jgi:hypothetical protein